MHFKTTRQTWHRNWLSLYNVAAQMCMRVERDFDLTKNAR